MLEQLKIKGVGCFANEFCGFEGFAKLNLVIGRNNSGKTRFIDFVRDLTVNHLAAFQGTVFCRAILDEKALREQFVGPGARKDLRGDLWDDHGRKLIGQKIDFVIDKGHFEFCENVYLGFAPSGGQSENITNIGRKNLVEKLLPYVKVPYYGKHFHRINSERHIQEESPSQNLAVSPNGTGATNVIRRYCTGSDLDESAINNVLLGELRKILAGDGNIRKIAIRELQKTDQARNGKWEIFVYEEGKGLIPLGMSGSGLQTVLLVLLNLLIIPLYTNVKTSDCIFAFEELENNLHPALQRRLFEYLGEFAEKSDCTIFLTTHSSVALDVLAGKKDTQIIHLVNDGSGTRSRTIRNHLEKVEILNDIGSRPSELLQANGVIWVEGPSDRVYINEFIRIFSDGRLVEGMHYQIAFYGGSLLSHISFCTPEAQSAQFVNLLNLNSNIALICDSDLTRSNSRGSRNRVELKEWVQRVKAEVDRIQNSFVWITKPKEIENYIPGTVWGAVYQKPDTPDPKPSDCFPSSPSKRTDYIYRNFNRRSFDKHDIAVMAIQHFKRSELCQRFDLEARMNRLVELINSWNR